jgi:hypothetical protein
MELKAYISVLLVKGFSFSSELNEIQKELKNRFKKEFTIAQIEEELLVMKLENEHGYVKEYPEDYVY